MIGSCCTIIGLMQILEWYKEHAQRKMLEALGVRLVGRLVRKWTFRRKVGKGSRQMYCIEARFRTGDAQRISRCLEITSEEYHAYQPPQNIEMIYLPAEPTLCNRYPVPAHSRCANCCVMFMSPTLTLLGLLWNWWSGAHGTVLVIYLCMVSCW